MRFGNIIRMLSSLIFVLLFISTILFIVSVVISLFWLSRYRTCLEDKNNILINLNSLDELFNSSTKLANKIEEMDVAIFNDEIVDFLIQIKQINIVIKDLLEKKIEEKWEK